MGLRELKKQKTRKAISDMATLLFVERGYHNVTTAEIAERAEVSVPTLFNYFPTKESLVFDQDDEVESELAETVVHRAKGQSILDALLQHGLKEFDEIPSAHKKQYKVFMNLVESTPELKSYSQQMWARHEQTLGETIRKEAKKKLSVHEATAIARFVLDAYNRSIATANPKTSLKMLFALLEKGWRE